jgi:hypothetical protein
MQCPSCGADIGIKREFCPRCGNRVEVAFDEIAASVREDAAARRGRHLEHYLTYGLVAFLVIGAAICGLNHLWDRPLVYDGADLPSITAPPVPRGEPPRIPMANHDLFRLGVPPGEPPRVFGYRLNPLRTDLVNANGGSDKTAKAVESGLEFLRARQTPDGSWPVSAVELQIKKERDETANHQWAKTGVTGLALMAFLGNGYTWVGPEAQRHPNQDCVKRGIAWLVKNQDRVNGRYGPPQGVSFMYNHGIATIAVAEAAGLSGDPFLRESAQKAVDLIQRIQGPKGGWKYKDEIAQGEEDASVTAWQVQALLAAREAGLKVDPAVLQKCLAFYQQATDPDGRVRYDLKDKLVFVRCPGVALMMRRLLGEEEGAPGLRLLTRKVGEQLPRCEPGWGTGWAENKPTVDHRKRELTFDPYAWYYATYGLFAQGGEDWQRWNSGPGGPPDRSGTRLGLVTALLELQEPDGSWHANDNWTVKGGVVHATALCILCLQVYYRLQ